MNFRQFVLLYAFLQMNGERTPSGVYHLLTGKRSQQSIQDAKWYHLTPFYAAYMTYSKEDFKKDMRFLLEKGYVYCTEQNLFVTDDGKKQVPFFMEKIPKELDGFTYGYVAIHFWRRLILYIQSLTNVVFHSGGFIPVITHYPTKLWVKQHFPKTKQERQFMCHQLYKELTNILIPLTDRQKELIVFQCTSDRVAGVTVPQLAKQYQEDETYVAIQFHAGLHQIIKEVIKQSEDYPVLYMCMKDVIKPYALTHTANETWNFVQRGYTVEEIASIRRLKISTIEDHLVEIALNIPTFSIDPYVSSTIIEEVKQKTKQQASRKLKVLKQSLSEDVSYFQIRLVLAKEGGM
ncbi:YpbB family protein [Massilibacterium senegalense]|uniref:helix-turn-helix domain-containing protein n=1 Tax=Massilibacterium senegalense TaxID=1632858 RepID=UPI0007864D65|nr:helix-turn-helix domain-containing protein [Massilibacterium senegalense]